MEAVAVDDAHPPMCAEALALDVLAETGRGMAELSLMEPRGPPPPGCAAYGSACMTIRRVNCPWLTWPPWQAGIRVHLARSFRLFHHCTPGDYLRRLRVERAGHLFAHHETASPGYRARMRLRGSGAVFPLVPRGARHDTLGLAQVTLIRVKREWPTADSLAT